MKAAVATGILFCAAAAAAVDPSGKVSLPPGNVPFSSLASEAARAQFVDAAHQPPA